MRLIVDLLACQTASRFRGIGRYTHSLIREMIRTSKTHDLLALANAAYSDRFEELRREFTGLLPAGRFLPYLHNKLESIHGENDPLFNVACTLVGHAYETLSPDIVLYPSIFEGLGEEGAVPLPSNGFPRALKSVIVYDFIPYIYSDRFLDPDPYYKQYYMRRFNILKKFDLLLAISESTRQDTIKFLDLPPDRVVNISAAASSIFQKKEYSTQEINTLFYRYGIMKPFVFYTGNVEYHKNMEVALRAYAQLSEHVRRNHQFVLTHVGDESAFRNRIHSLGLDDHEVVITGHISDEDLVALYNCCKLYIFPSLYEGFGLPILEAMACGAPVIAANNSSIPEVMGREDAMFDASSEHAISLALHKALTNDSFRLNLSSYGLDRVKQFRWEKSAQTAWSAMEEALGRCKQDRQLHVSVPSNKSKLRIAYISPLPPAKSGVADYSADLLPYLSRYVDIDLFVESGMKVTDPQINDMFHIYPWKDLIKRQDDYDTVVYQFGNSKYHRHMFRLLREVPGIVVLHDFFLSHIREYIYSTNYLDNPHGDFISEVGEVHGIFGMVDFLQRGLSKAIWDWPLNWNILKYAKNIIVHSNFQNVLIRKYYGHGWYPHATVINQLHKLENVLPPDKRILHKQKLGIKQEDFTFCSFGFLNSTKLNLLTVEAFAKHLSINSDASLIFVGEIDKGEYENTILELINKLGVSERVRITGFVDIDTYRSYLMAADAAIQLRIDSRGETSRAVLDCMAFGIPTIINAHGSLNDYHEDDVVKLKEFPGIHELAQAMVQLHQDNNCREMIGRNARNAIHNRHDPNQVAAAYYNVIQKVSLTNDRIFFAPAIDAIVNANTDSLEDVSQSMARLAASNLSLRNQPRLLIDVTNISYLDHRTGIQRVVKNLIKGLYSTQDPSRHVELIKINEGKLFRASRFAEKLFSLPEESMGREAPISIQTGDTLFMLDTSWNLFDQFLPVFDKVRKAGGRIYAMLYDMIPVKYPHFCTGPTVEYFKAWIDKVIFESDEIIAISNAVVADVEEYIQEHFPNPSHVCRLSYIHLGADIPVIQEEADVREEVYKLVDTPASPLFLMVGTIEPRKGHSFALDGFEYLWAKGHNVRLCIAGKIGWNIDDFADRLRKHPDLGSRLHFIENPTDKEINILYQNVTGLISASIAEGFGLPIVEAGLYKVPSIASDIPVFREVGGTGAEYFSLNSHTELANAIIKVSNLSPDERKAMAERVEILTWEQSTAWLQNIIFK